MMRIFMKVKPFSILFWFSICLCICIIGSNPATAQNFSFPPNPIYGNPFGIQGMSTSGSLFTPNYQWGQTWNPFGSNLNPNFRVFTPTYYSGSSQTKEMAKGELIIYLSNQVQIEHHENGPTTNIPELNALIEQYGVYEIKASGSGGFYVLKFSKSHDVNDVSKAFEGLTGYVESTEPNFIRKAHTTSPSYNTMMGAWAPQTSSFPGLNVSYPGTGLTLGPQLPTTQPFYSSFPFSQYTSGPGFPFSQFTSGLGLTYNPAWQTQGFSSLQPLFNTWQQTSWDTSQPYYINPFPGNWF